MERLDLLIYAHDGRGLGHVSRGVAIGLAVRRLFPHLRVLLVSGSPFTGELTLGVSLDWLKLPSYATRVESGVSRGLAGPSGYSDPGLGTLRGRLLEDIVARLRPRCVLVDHMPQGKHRELLPSLTAGQPGDALWVLGVRGIVGDVKGVWSELAGRIFRDRFHAILWYGDANVLGTEPLERLADHFGQAPVETGYVSRLEELIMAGAVRPPRTHERRNVAALPWAGEDTSGTMETLGGAIQRLGGRLGKWDVFLSTEERRSVPSGPETDPFLTVRPVGSAFLPALAGSKFALVYGGYNTVTDVLCARVPAMVLLRGMADREQQDHLGLLGRVWDRLMPVDASAFSAEALIACLERWAGAERPEALPFAISGAEAAARRLCAMIGETPSARTGNKPSGNEDS
ncbi:MAG: hypothetical protein ACOWWM_19500 [Desulfobacterales bacterium]